MAYTTINKSSDYFNTKLYAGSGAVQTISGIGFEPSWIWTKARTNQGNHKVTDQVRGLTKYVRTNGNNAEETHTNSITAVNNDGFVLGADSTNDFNASGQNYVSFNWKANGQGSSNTDGSINTTYTSANTTSGFSIIKYTGTGSNATIGHGLGVAPEAVMIKKTNTTSDWVVGQNGYGGWNYVTNLNSASGRADQANQFQSTAPSSSVITLGTESQVNGSGATFICYAFAPKTGYSKFGSYIGNGSTNGSFVYTGFKPAWLLIKRIVGGDAPFCIFDNKRDGYNPNKLLLANNTNVESSANFDILSNGFKTRTTDGEWNGSGNTYAYMAIGQTLVGSNNVPCTAR
tara:strand:+ start:523 stop:1557 length:1035 start_codon:yes stop_codon:yes gene_type:complete